MATRSEVHVIARHGACSQAKGRQDGTGGQIDLRIRVRRAGKGKAKSAQDRQRERCGLSRLCKRDAAIGDGRRYVSVYCLGWFSGLLQFPVTFGFVQSPMRSIVAGRLALVQRTSAEHHLCRVDAARCLDPRYRAEADDLRDECSLKLGAQPAARSRGIPHTEDQSRGTKSEQPCRVTDICGVQEASCVRLAENDPVQQAVTEQGIGGAVRRLEAGYRELLEQFLLFEARQEQGQCHLAGSMSIE